jgi:septum formation protein
MSESNPKPSLVLASGSLTRRQMLDNAGLAATIDAADIDEAALKAQLMAKGEVAPEQIAEALALAKALAVAPRHPGAIVLGADQILALGTEIMSKARDVDEARLALQRLSGRRHALHSGMALVRDGTVLWRHHESAFLDMRRLSPAAIEGYLATGDSGILSSVGSYRIEGPGIRLFERIAGDHFTILGLPLLPLLAELRRLGIEP